MPTPSPIRLPMVRLVLDRLTTCEPSTTASVPSPTPVTPVITGSAAAQTERNTSSRMSRAARIPTASVPSEAPTDGAKAVPPTCTLRAALRNCSAACSTGLTSAPLARVTVA